jgi:ADP-ribose pyrophosphatase
MKITSSKEVYRCRLFRVTEDEASDGAGYEIHRSVVRHRGSAVMMAVDEHDRILLVQQYRLPANAKMWEIPAGSLDPGETGLVTAKRELKEETGYTADNWKLLVTFYPSPGFVEEKMELFLATGLTAGEATPMDDERIEARWFTPDEIDRMILVGEIQDGKTLIGYLHWRRYSKP